MDKLGGATPVSAVTTFRPFPVISGSDVVFFVLLSLVFWAFCFRGVGRLRWSLVRFANRWYGIYVRPNDDVF